MGEVPGTILYLVYLGLYLHCTTSAVLSAHGRVGSMKYVAFVPESPHPDYLFEHRRNCTEKHAQVAAQIFLCTQTYEGCVQGATTGLS